MNLVRSSFYCVRVCALAATVLLIASPAVLADQATLQAVENQDVESAFTLNFADLGIATTSRVISTRFQLAIDEDAGTAHFVSYDQQVEPLILPGPTGEPLSTGELTIRIVPGSSTGTYNRATETFTTSEQYEISFTGDLSAVGFESPVILPSTTVGQLKGGAAGATEIQMNWTGVGQLGPLDFNYVCEVNTVIEQPGPVASFVSLISGLCGGGIATMMAFGVLGMGLMKLRLARRRF